MTHEQILELADSMSNTTIIMPKNEDLIAFAEAIIESYKAELLKEVGGPVAIVGELSEPTRSEVVGKDNPLGRYLFTSDQVAAAILKVTGPLKHELRELRMSTRMRGEDIDELRAQLAATIASVKGEQ